MSAPYRFIDRRGANQYAASIQEAARGTRQRTARTGYDRDTWRLNPAWGRLQLLSLSRWLYANVLPVRGAVNEIADIAAGNLAAQFDGDDSEWGRVAEIWMETHDRICCVSGETYSMQMLRRLIALHIIRDGDVGVLLVRLPESDYPQFQLIPAHRIRSETNATVVVGGVYDGATIVDGVILNEFGRPIAYQVTDDQGRNPVQYSARDLRLIYIPDYSDQVRGIPALASSAIHWQDWDDAQRFELMAQKKAASLTFLEHNETGEPPEDAATILGSPQTNACVSEALTHVEEMHGGEYRYARSLSGAKIEAITLDRPSANQQSFMATIVRNCMFGLGWSVDFSFDPSKVGGASMRIVIEKCNRTLEKIREFALYPTSRWMDGWRISVATQLGLVPSSPDWYKWRYQGASKLTADARYQFEVSKGEVDKGFSSVQAEAASRGRDWESMLDQQIDYLAAVQAKCTAKGVDPSLILTPASTVSVSKTEEVPAEEPDETPEPDEEDQ
jgi:capsid protein